MAHTEATKQKMRLAALGNQRAKGNKLSDDHKRILSTSKMGANNPNWKGGIYSTNRKLRRSPQYKRWQKAVYERDDFSCQICGVRGGSRFRANHIKKFADYPELRFELSNGITLCKSCDISLVMYHEAEWESYFNFNLETRGVI